MLIDIIITTNIFSIMKAADWNQLIAYLICVKNMEILRLIVCLNLSFSFLLFSNEVYLFQAKKESQR